MRALASVILVFAAVGCVGQPMEGAASSAFEAPTPPHAANDPLCAGTIWPAGIGSDDDVSNPWIDGLSPDMQTSGYVLWTPALTNEAGVYNIEVFGMDKTLSTTLWSKTVQSDKIDATTLEHYQTMPNTMPLQVPAPTSPAIKPAAQPVGGDGVGQIGSVDVPLGNGTNEPGAYICLDDQVNYLPLPGLVAIKSTAYQCIPKVPDPCTADHAYCGSLTDDCNVLHYCGTCLDSQACNTAHVCITLKPFNPPPCHGKCI